MDFGESSDGSGCELGERGAVVNPVLTQDGPIGFGQC